MEINSKSIALQVFSSVQVKAIRVQILTWNTYYTYLNSIWKSKFEPCLISLFNIWSYETVEWTRKLEKKGGNKNWSTFKNLDARVGGEPMS